MAGRALIQLALPELLLPLLNLPAVHAKRSSPRSLSLSNVVASRGDVAVIDPYTVNGNAAIEENAAEVPMDHSTAVTYILSFCIIIAVVCCIVTGTFIVKYRRRRRAQLREKGDAGAAANWEKIGARAHHAQRASGHFKRMGIFHPSTACLRQLDYRLPCCCPACIGEASGGGGGAANTDSAGPPRPSEVHPPSTDTIPSRPRMHIRGRSRNNENTYAGFLRTRPIPLVSLHEHEWTLVHGSQPATPAPSMPMRAGPELRPIELARLSQVSPLSSLRSSLIQELERPPLFSDASGLSTTQASTLMMKDVDDKEEPEDPLLTLSTFSAFKFELPAAPEADLSNKMVWISDDDWICDAPLQLQPLGDGDTHGIHQTLMCSSSSAKEPVSRLPLADVESNSSV